MHIKNKKNYLFLLFILPALIWVIAFTIYPFFYSIIISFTDMSLLRPAESNFVVFRNYIALFKDATFWHSVERSLTFTSIVVFFQWFLGFLLALLLVKKRRFVSIVRMSIMLPWVLPPIALALIWAWVLKAGNMGLVNAILYQNNIHPIAWFGQDYAMMSIIGVTIWIGVPLSFMLEMASLQKIPGELYEAAAVDGANGLKRLFFITIPLMKDTFRINLIMITIATIGYFDIIYAITQGGPNGITDVLPMLMYNTAFRSQSMGRGSAIAVIMLLISAIFTVFYIIIFREKRSKAL